MPEMHIGEISVRTRIQLRDRFGRFSAQLSEDAVQTAKDLTDKAVELAKAHAPVRSGFLRDTIQPAYAGKVGYVEVGAPYGHAIEKGAIPHAIPRGDHIIMHPGNAAQPYLEPAGRELGQYAEGIVQRNYP